LESSTHTRSVALISEGLFFVHFVVRDSCTPRRAEGVEAAFRCTVTPSCLPVLVVVAAAVFPQVIVL
jgi:hypothetical protein